MSRVALLFLVLATSAACGPAANVDDVDGVPPTMHLEVEPSALTLVADGPFVAEEGAPIVDCGAGGVLLEGGSVEVRTAYCDPADLAIVINEAIPAGTVLDVTLSHDPLIADGGEAHLAVALGDEVLWEQRTPLPAPAAFLSPRVAVARDHAAGERLVVHVHNHGSNTYALHGLSLRAP